MVTLGFDPSPYAYISYILLFSSVLFWGRHPVADYGPEIFVANPSTSPLGPTVLGSVLGRFQTFHSCSMPQKDRNPVSSLSLLRLDLTFLDFLKSTILNILAAGTLISCGSPARGSRILKENCRRKHMGGCSWFPDFLIDSNHVGWNHRYILAEALIVASKPPWYDLRN